MLEPKSVHVTKENSSLAVRLAIILSQLIGRVVEFVGRNRFLFAKVVENANGVTIFLKNVQKEAPFCPDSFEQKPDKNSCFSRAGLHNTRPMAVYCVLYVLIINNTYNTYCIACP